MIERVTVLADWAKAATAMSAANAMAKVLFMGSSSWGESYTRVPKPYMEVSDQRHGGKIPSFFYATGTSCLGSFACEHSDAVTLTWPKRRCGTPSTTPGQEPG